MLPSFKYTDVYTLPDHTVRKPETFRSKQTIFMLYKLCCEGVGFVDGSLLNVFSAAVATNSAFALKCTKDAPSLMEKQFDSSEAETATLIIN